MSFYTKFIVFFTFLMNGFFANSQSCQGSLGDPIINYNFGSGNNPGPPLAVTNYAFSANDCPVDSSYAVRNLTANCFNNTWHYVANDKTGNTNGYFMLINASVAPSAFYIDTVRGLCANTNYEFAAWIMNVIFPSACNGNTSQPNITFSIEQTNGTVIQTSSTGNIPPTSLPIWIQKSTFFTTASGVTDVVVRMVNNAAGGCGNDLALDDITFRACGPLVSSTINGSNNTTTSICEGTARSLNFSATVSAGYTMPVYQWQQSFNGSIFTDIAGANSTNYTANFLASAPIGVYTFRLATAEARNINSLNCRINSAPITVNVVANPVISATSNSPVCQGSALNLMATGGVSYQWSGPGNFVDSVSNPVRNNLQQADAGNYTVIAKNAEGCTNTAFTTAILNPSPMAVTGIIDTEICIGETVQLSASGNGTFNWFPVQNISGETSSNPIVNPTTTTEYFVVVTNQFNCTDTASTKVNVLRKPVVNAGADKIIVAGQPVQLNGTVTGNNGSFEWSPPTFISDVNILNPIVNPPVDALYILTAGANKCGTGSDSVSVKIYQGIFIPNTFSPNGDNLNDNWNIPALQAYPLHELTVYNRYGQIVFERKKTNLAWNGKFKNQQMPNGAYSYFINLKNGMPVIKGSVLLLR